MLSTDISLGKGKYRVRLAQTPEDVAAAQALRARCFDLTEPDCDSFDQRCLHMLIHESRSGTLVCCFRLLLPESGVGLDGTYSAQFYDLSALASFAGRIAELGRFCVDPTRKDPDILRAAWAALTDFVDENDIRMLIGCSSFPGTQPGPYLQTFALLNARHLAPPQWLPGVRAPVVVRFNEGLLRKPDPVKAMAHMPPLLRSYLAMGGWVSDHAVVDHALNTLHVFTGLEIAAIPKGRKRLLRRLAH